MVSHLGSLAANNAVMYEVNRAVGHGALQFFGMVMTPVGVSTFRCCCSFQPPSCSTRKGHHLNDDTYLVRGTTVINSCIVFITAHILLQHERYKYVQYFLCNQQLRRLLIRISAGIVRSFYELWSLACMMPTPDECPRTDGRPRKLNIPYKCRLLRAFFASRDRNTQRNVFPFISRLSRIACHVGAGI